MKARRRGGLIGLPASSSPWDHFSCFCAGPKRPRSRAFGRARIDPSPAMQGFLAALHRHSCRGSSRVGLSPLRVPRARAPAQAATGLRPRRARLPPPPPLRLALLASLASSRVRAATPVSAQRPQHPTTPVLDMGRGALLAATDPKSVRGWPGATFGRSDLSYLLFAIDTIPRARELLPARPRSSAGAPAARRNYPLRSLEAAQTSRRPPWPTSPMTPSLPA